MGGAFVPFSKLYCGVWTDPTIGNLQFSEEKMTNAQARGDGGGGGEVATLGNSQRCIDNLTFGNQSQPTQSNSIYQAYQVNAFL